MIHLFAHFTIKKEMAKDQEHNAWGMVCGTVGILQGIAPYLTMHDFRLAPGRSVSRLFFDVVVPLGFPKSPEALRDLIEKETQARTGTPIEVSIHVDTDYTVTLAKT